MSTLTRKQREVRQREQMLLTVARKMLIEQGYAGLSMDRLAEATEYSKGTIYQHFSTKEDLVTALAVESKEQRLALFEKARGFQGRPRERMLALGVADELFALLNPHFFRSEQIICLADLESRASGERRETMVRQDACILAWIREIVQEGVETGDLPSRGSIAATVNTVVSAVLSLALGSHSLMINFPHILHELEITSPLATTRDNIHTLLDGFAWQPLRSAWDYEAMLKRIFLEVFADECRLASLI